MLENQRTKHILFANYTPRYTPLNTNILHLYIYILITILSIVAFIRRNVLPDCHLLIRVCVKCFSELSFLKYAFNDVVWKLTPKFGVVFHMKMNNKFWSHISLWNCTHILGSFHFFGVIFLWTFLGVILLSSFLD